MTKNIYSYSTLKKENITPYPSNVGHTLLLSKDYSTERIKTNFTMDMLPQLGN